MVRICVCVGRCGHIVRAQLVGVGSCPPARGARTKAQIVRQTWWLIRFLGQAPLPQSELSLTNCFQLAYKLINFIMAFSFIYI